MLRICSVALCAAMYLCTGAIAEAANDTSFRIFDWAGRMSWNKQEKQLDRCSAQLTNADGITIIYSLDRHYVWSLEISSPTWNFTKDASFPVNFRVGEHGYFSFRAVATDANLVNVKLPDSLAVFDAFRRAIQVGFAAGGLTSHFDLTYGPQVLMALTKCVARSAASARHHKEIAAWLKTFTDPKLSDAADAPLHKEANALAGIIMTEARIAKASSVPQAEATSGLTGDAYWKIGNIIFSISILPQQEMSSFENLPNLIIDSEVIRCHGDLFSGAIIDVIGKTRAARAITNCVTPQATSTSYYLAIPRKQGGIYIFTTTIVGFELAALGGQTAEEIDGRVRASVNVALSKLDEVK